MITVYCVLGLFYNNLTFFLKNNIEMLILNIIIFTFAF